MVESARTRETLSFSLSKRDYLIVLLQKSWKGMLVVPAIFAFFAILEARKPNPSTGQLVYLLAMALGLSLIRLAGFWLFVRSPKNRNLFEEKQLQFDLDHFTIRQAEVGSATYKWMAVVETKKIPKGFLLYFSGNHFEFVANNCFHTEEDRKLFERLVAENTAQLKW